MAEKQQSLNSMLSRAGGLARKGDVEGARGIYQSILERFPQNERARRELDKLPSTIPNAILNPSATSAASTSFLGGGANIGLAPNIGGGIGDEVPQADKDKLVGLLKQEKLDEAIAYTQKLYKSYPQSSLLPRVISMVYGLQGKTREAASWGEELALHDGANEVDDYMRLAAIHGENEDYENARLNLEKVLAIEPENIEAMRGFASCLCVMENYEEGVKEYLKFLEVEPDDVVALREISKAYREMDNHYRAIETVEKAMELDPDNDEILPELGASYVAGRRHDKAIGVYEKLIALEPDAHYHYVSLAHAMRERDMPERGFELLEKALTLAPDAADIFHCRATLHKVRRNKQASHDDFRKALEIQPDSASVWHAFALSHKFTPDNAADIATMIEQLEACDEGEYKTIDARTYYNFSLGKAYEDIGDHEKSFSHYSAAAVLRKEKLKYDFTEEQKSFDVVRQVFSQLNADDYVGAEDEYASKKKMIFILGMPRSGTSLTEQILDSHSLVHGAGELNFMNEQTAELLFMFGLQPEVRMQKVGFTSVGNGYMDSIEEINASEPYITDKLPHNFLRLGFILGAFPDAKVIHMNRDPIAVCWSNFQRFFPARGMAFSFDFDTLAQYYKLYLGIMDFWRQQFPGRIYDLDYEKLTRNQEEETRKLLAHCGLAWEQQCLDFHLNKRHVHTASQDQVQRKMYQGSSQAWRAYEKQLAPLIEELKDVLPQSSQ